MDTSDLLSESGRSIIYHSFLNFFLRLLLQKSRKHFCLGNSRSEHSFIHSSQSAFSSTLSHHTAMKKIHSIFIDLLLFSAILKFQLQIFLFLRMFYYKRDSLKSQNAINVAQAQ